jgi:hypothetical protein
LSTPLKTKRAKTKRAKTKRAVRRDDKHHRLHEAVDRVLDGPVEGRTDEWVVQVLVDIGLFIRAAAPALDFEIGRVIAGVDRPLGHFPCNTTWRNAGLSVSPEQANAWIAAGDAARSEMPSPATRQRALAALFRPVASVSCHSWLHDLVDAMDALRFGEERPLLARSDRGLHAVGKGMIAWQLRLRALCWVEFQVSSHKLKTKGEAYERVASAFLREVATIKEWHTPTSKELGGAVVREALEQSRRAGELFREISEGNNGDAGERDRLLKHFEHPHSDRALEAMATAFAALPRKKHKAGKRGAHIPMEPRKR